MTPAYSDFDLPVYINTSPAINLIGSVNDKEVIVPLSVPDIMLAQVILGLNCLLISDTGRGKTQLVQGIRDTWFGGSGNDGKANYFVARPKMSSLRQLFEITEIDTSEGKYSSRNTHLDENRVQRLLLAVDEMNRIPELMQAELFDLADGTYNFGGQSIHLGKDGYSCFIGTANVNRNGDNGFSGTFSFDRALLSRAHVTLDLDHPRFRPTPEDKLILAERGYQGPKVKTSEIRDLSSEILVINQTLKTFSKQKDVSRTVFRFLIDEALDYCLRDTWNDKDGCFPMSCPECEHKSKLCSLAKSSSERTVQAVEGLALGFNYVASMKYPDIVLDSLDCLLEAFKLTSYHGNLNSVVLAERFNGRRQFMMELVSSKLRDVIDKIKPFVVDNKLKNELYSLISHDGKTYYFDVSNSQLKKQLDDKSYSYNLIKLEDILSAEGLGSSWVSSISKRS